MSLRIDRASFLTLTFGLSGFACNTGQSSVVAANVVEIPPQPAQPPDGGTSAPASAAKTEGAAKLRAAPVTTEEDDAHDDVGSNVSEGQIRVVPLGTAKGCGWVDPKAIVRPAAACKDDQGTVGSCSVMKKCSGFPFPEQQCESYRKLLKPRVAQKAIDCLAKLSATQVCDACNAYRCGDLALKSACPDTSVDAQCTQITTKCAAVSMTECRMYLAGLNAAGRAKMVSCLVTKSGCGFGIFSCAESL